MSSKSEISETQAIFQKVIDALESKEVMLLVLTGLGYILCYVFNLTVLSHYRIPITYVSVNVTGLITSVLFMLFVILMLVGTFADYFEYEKRHKKNKLKKWGGRLPLLFLLCVLVYIFSDSNIKPVLFIVGFLTIFPLLLLIIQSIQFRDFKKAFRELSSSAIWKSSNNSKLKTNLDFVPKVVVVYVLAVLLAIALGFLAGKVFTVFNSEFAVVNTHGDIKGLVVNKNGSELLVADYDVNKKEFTKRFRIIESIKVTQQTLYDIRK